MRARWPLVTLLSLSAVVSVSAGASPPELVPGSGPGPALTRRQTAHALRIRSAILGESREIYVVLPASYDRTGPGRRYPVIVVLDGEANLAPAAAVSAELSGNGQIPECVIVAIPNVGGATAEASAQRRVHDLTPPGLSVSGSGVEEGGDRFLDFIERELLPAVDRRYRGGAPRTLIGHSSGGILATYAAATRPAFRLVVAIDTPAGLGAEWLPRRLMARARAAGPVPLRYASYEARFGWGDAAWDSLAAAAPAGWMLHRERLVHESHESLAMLAMYLGLRELFGDYASLSAPQSPTTSVLPHYERVGAALGATVVPPQGLLRSVAEDLAAEGRGSAAREAYRALAAGYGAPADSAALTARIAEVERRPPPTETVEGLLATPFPTPEQAARYLGEWVGDTWMDPDQPRTHAETLRVRIEDGRVVGETVWANRPAEFRVRRWEYLKITPNGMTWGFMNGMRPRGVVLNEGVLRGDTLAGEGRFGGIDFRLADGSSPPPRHFSFTRVRP